ncbi:MAG: hypothetical protein HKL95_09465 [Phycisphaerae bacterium]|nr:hypothetical protein [Phycisphaerae bacterium]
MNVSVLSRVPAHDYFDFPESARIAAAMRELAGTDLLAATVATTDSQGMLALWSGGTVADLPGVDEIMPLGLAKRKRADDDDIADEDDDLDDDDDDGDDDDDDDDDFDDDDDDVEEGFDDEDIDDDEEIFYDEDEDE